ncbi:hypothetical protein [Brachybacterium vulturis]|uniref:hypothetical protein n=1 Tax=Brachybacterium vulturis TaxID=2017484 RepID=UPI0036540BC5
MRKLAQPQFDRAMRRDWPMMMDATDIAEFTGWTKLTILNWIKEGQLTGALTLSDSPKSTVLIPRELVFAQLDPRQGLSAQG